MSEAGRKMDVEDVLSSIRRLVSEEARTVIDESTRELKSETEHQSEEQPVAATPEKLVLTPAFRVSESNQPKEPLAKKVPQAPIAEDVSLEAESAVEPQPITPESPPQEAPFAEVDISEIDTTEHEVAVKIVPETEVTEEIPAASFTEAETEDSAEAIEPQAEIEDANELASSEPEAEAEFIEISEEITADLEDVATAFPEQELDDAPEQKATAAPSGYENIDYTADSDSYLDEEALRELVSEMVRTELQGELGDRITRNVRKLVRREIHRALASRDFE